MDIFQFAKQIELDGISFYQEAANNTTLPGLKKIFELLINEEQKHYFYFDVLAQDFKTEPMKPFPVSDAKDIFRQLRENNEGDDLTVEQIKIYEKAWEFEKRSEKFYREQAALITDDKQKTLIMLIAEEEKKHVLFVGELVAYLTRPSQWVEHADFSQLKDDY